MTVSQPSNASSYVRLSGKGELPPEAGGLSELETAVKSKGRELKGFDDCI